MTTRFDLAVVGAGIVGIAHALAAARRGLRVVVIDRDRQANGASIRNFGLAIVTGQEPGPSRRLAERSREIWLELAQDARLDILHRGKLIVAQRPEALALLETFKAGEHGAECRLLTAREAAAQQTGLDEKAVIGGLYSPFELRVESRDVLPRLTAFLAEKHGVAFRTGVSVTEIAPPFVETSGGRLQAEKVVVCPGDDFSSLYPQLIEKHGLQRCKLQMLRLADPGFKLRSALMSDLSLLRYGGFAVLPEAGALRKKLSEERGAALANGVHLIVVQSADGSLVVGDSHHYGLSLDPFGLQAVDQLILDEFGILFGKAPDVLARWTGSYASAKNAVLRESPHEDVRLVIVTSGAGASTGFGLGEETITELFGQ